MLIDHKTKEIGAIFKALRENKEDLIDLADAVCRIETKGAALYRIEEQVKATNHGIDKAFGLIDELRRIDRNADRKGRWLAWGLVAAFVTASGTAGYDIWQHWKESAALTAKIENLYPYMAEDWDHDDMALYGLPAKIECSQVLDGDGGIDIRFTSIRTPVAGSNNGSTTTASGTLKADGRLEWTITTKELDGTDGTLPGSDKSVRPAAAFCKKALTGAPGVAG